MNIPYHPDYPDRYVVITSLVAMAIAVVLTPW